MTRYVFTIIGGVASFIGLLIIVLTIVFLRINRVKNIVTGVVFMLIGMFIVWLSLLDRTTFHFDLGVSEGQFGIFLLILGYGAFALKAVLNIREGRERLRDKTLSPFSVFNNRFKIIAAILFLIFVASVVIWILSVVHH
jgi:hypothetical protein